MLSVRLRENDLNTAKLSFQSRRVTRISRIIPAVINISSAISPDWPRVETFIKSVFRDTYWADIEIHYPFLISVNSHDGEILAAAGFRYADQDPLFLEQYTTNPIEQELSALYEKDIELKEIVEIGSLASSGNGASIFLFAALASYLDFKQINYTVITGTRNLHRHLKMLGLQPRKVCDAEQSLLHTTREDWGSYYATRPCVMAGSVQQGVESLQRTLGSVYEQQIPFRYHTGRPS